MVKEVTNDHPGKRKFLVQCLLIIIIIFTTLIVFLFVNLLTKNGNGIFCKTNQCIKAASDIIDQIDESKQPCNNFYYFACKRVAREGPMRENLTHQINEMISSPMTRNDSRVFKMQKLFYQRCIDVGQIEQDQNRELLSLFKRLGGYPLLEEHWNPGKYHWTEFMAKTRKEGVKFDWFLEFQVVGTFHTLAIKIPNYLSTISEKKMFNYAQLMVDIVVLLGANLNEQLVKEIERTIKFEMQLQRIMEKHRQKNFLFEKRTISEIRGACPNIHWSALLNNITGKYFDPMSTIFFNTEQYIKETEHEIFGTPKRIQVNFMLWKIIEQIWPYLTKPIRDKFEAFQGTKHDRTEFCVNDSRKRFHLVANAEYIRRHVTPQKRALAKHMVDVVRSKFEKDIWQVSWLNQRQKTEAIQYTRNVSVIIGGPREIFDEEEYTRYLGLSRFVFLKGTALGMVLEHQIQYHDEYYGLLQRPTQETNLLADLKLNETAAHSIQAPMLQDKYFHPEKSDYLNFGTIGTLIAYKLAEMLYEHDHNYIDWTSGTFNNISDCLMKQNPQLQLQDLKDNFDDYIAAEISYRSYDYFIHLKENPLPLPGLKYNDRQLFWIQAAIFLCNRSKNQQDAEIRVQNAIKNSENFDRDFSCSRPKKCKIL